MSLPGVEHPPADYEKQLSFLDAFEETEIEPVHAISDSYFGNLDTERDVATHIISVHDDPTMNPWTLRAFIVGLGLSAFGGVLGKPFDLLRLIFQR